jgi:hypothetical protein
MTTDYCLLSIDLLGCMTEPKIVSLLYSTLLTLINSFIRSSRFLFDLETGTFLYLQ